MVVARNMRQFKTKQKQDFSPKGTKSIAAFAKENLDTNAAIASKLVEARKSGRPRSNASQDAILDAASKLLLHSSVRDVSIEAIAKKAGVGKTTIYRWWPNKVAVILDAVSDKNSVSFDVNDTVSVEDRMVAHLERFARLMKGRNGMIIAELFAEAQGNEEDLEVFYRNFMMAHEDALAEIITLGKDNGSFKSSIATDLAVDMIYGGLFYRLMSSGETLEIDFVNGLIMEALRLVK